MADNTNKQVKQFVNDYARPIAEAARALNYRIASASIEWDTISSLVPSNKGTIIDGHTSNPITNQELREALAILQDMYNARDDIKIQKLCVRALDITV